MGNSGNQPIRLPLDPNRLNHIFGNTKHKWNLTGLSQNENIQLIEDIANTPAKFLASNSLPNGITVLTFQATFNNLTIVVKVFEDTNGIKSISNAWMK
jgi:hypothetical protein